MIVDFENFNNKWEEKYKWNLELKIVLISDRIVSYTLTQAIF